MGWGTGNIGNGSGGLNFKVIGGTSAPTSPKENMIWVNTDVDITGYYFSATEPEAPIEGMVWIITGTSSTIEFNALKKNGIQVYPLYAKQYVSGALVDVTAMSYQGGEWVSWWNGELYSPGNEWPNLTGGWTGTAIQSYSQTTTPAKVPSITRNDDNITVTNPDGSGVFHTANKINLKDYNTITFKGNFYRGGSVNYNLVFGCWSALNGYFTQNVVAQKYLGSTTTEVILDVSAVDGEYYVGIGLVDQSTAMITSVVMS